CACFTFQACLFACCSRRLIPWDADAFVTLISQGTDHKPVAAHLTACAPVLEQVSLYATAGRLFVVADFAFAIRPLAHLLTGVTRCSGDRGTRHIRKQHPRADSRGASVLYGIAFLHLFSLRCLGDS